jgi:hypothetical protein
MTDDRSAQERSDDGRPAAVWPVLLGLATLKATLHIVAAMVDWGYARDELYLLDSTDRLDWGYVDHPPLSIVALAAVRPLLGDALLAIRAVPALLGAVTVVLAGLLAREMGGGRVAQSLSALMIVGWPAFMAIDSYYSLNAFDAVFWMLAVFLVLRILNGSSPRLWLALGATIGIGLLNKWTLAALALGLGLGLLASRDRHWLATRWPWLAAALALALLMPNLVWQAHHGWPTLEFLHNAAASKNAPTTALSFLADQAMMAHPLFAPFWIGGLVYLLSAAETERFRLAAWIWIAVFGLFMASGAAKSYYVAPAYPVLLAAGGCAVERIARERRWRWLPATAAVWLIVSGIAGAPFALPILTPEQFIAYQRSLGISPPRQHVDEAGPIPLHLAVRLHGRVVFDAVSKFYEQLPPEERQRVGIFASSCHQAAAVNHWGRRLGMPSAISSHNSYWIWGPGTVTGDPMIVIWPRDRNLGWWFEDVTRVADFDCPYCMGDLMNHSIYFARGPRKSLGQIWPELKSYR